MGIMIRGICRSCNRTSPIHDPENTWCYRCANDPEHRARCDRNIVASYVGFLAFFVLVIFAMGYCK
jgi:hypothetical protein